jgi:hypothetical protein
LARSVLEFANGESEKKLSAEREAAPKAPAKGQI